MKTALVDQALLQRNALQIAVFLVGARSQDGLRINGKDVPAAQRQRAGSRLWFGFLHDARDDPFVHRGDAVVLDLVGANVHQAYHRSTVCLVSLDQMFGGLRWLIRRGRRVDVHQEIVPQHHQEGAVNGVKGRFNRIAHAFRFELDVGENLHPFGCVKQFSIEMRTKGVKVRTVVKHPVKRLGGRHHHVKAFNPGRFGFEDQMRQQGDVDQGKRFLGQKCTAGKHTGPQSCGHENRISNHAHTVGDGDYAFKRGPPARIMEKNTDERWLFVVGGLLLAQSFTTLAPAGPWDAPSFTRGVLGLLGMVLLYLGWFKRTFGFYGVAPTVNRWQDPQTSWLRVVVFGLACLVLTRALRLLGDGELAPEPAGLLLSLVGGLALMNGLYVWLITNGPLLEEEE